MQPVDWIIVVVIVLTMAGGLSQGFLRGVFGLAGVFLGLVLAAWNYTRAAALVLPFVRFEAIANAVGFLLIAVVVMGLAAVAGKIVSKTAHHLGMGCLDRLAGAAFGLLQGALLVTLVVLVAVAFFPNSRWLTEARLPRFFFGACHISTHLSPRDLAERVQLSLKALEEATPGWMHPGGKEL